MRTAIIGAGSLGIVMGALMNHRGRTVELIDIDEANVRALNSEGARIIGALELTAPVRACTPAQMRGQYDLVFLLNKQTSNPAVLSNLRPYLHADSVVCTLQNGLPEEDVAAVIGRERTVGGVVGFGATRTAPGVSMLTSPAEALASFAFDVGKLDGGEHPRLAQVQAYLACVGGTRLTSNLVGIRWTKLLMNATFSGMSAALGCSFGELLADDKAMTCLAFVADECVKVSRAEGVTMAEALGKDFTQLAFEHPREIPSKMPLYHEVWGPHAKLKASMLQDLEHGRLCEIDHINGLICRKGEARGIATPFNDKVVELVSAAQLRGGVNDFSYVAEFDELLAAHAAGA